MAPERNGHLARLDVNVSRHVCFFQYGSEHDLAGERLALDEALKRRHGRHDLLGAGHAELDARRVLVPRLLAETLHAVHQLTRQAFLNQILRQSGIDRGHVRTVGLHRPVAHDLARHQHVLRPELELAGPHGVTTFKRLQLFRRELRHARGGAGCVLTVALAQAAELRLALEPDEIVVRTRHFDRLGVHFGGQDI
jgi:hypothetical protein